MSGGSRCCFSLLTLLAEVLLFGSVALVVAWCLKYRGGFAWTEDPNLQFNLHPVLMVAGFVFFAGHGESRSNLAQSVSGFVCFYR